MRYLFSLIALLAALPCSTFAEHNWPQFLGPDRNGISDEQGMLDTWPQDGPKELWRTKGGVGMSGLAIQSNRLVTMVQTDGKQRVICLEAQTGKSIWTTDVSVAYDNGQGKGPRATPSIVDDTIFAYTGEGILVALRLTDGKLIWSRNTIQEHSGKVADYGMSCSPLVVGDRAIVTVGAPTATVAAYDKKTGDLAWVANEGDKSGYSSPALLTLQDRLQIVVFTGASVLGLAPESGNVLWRYPYVTDYDCNIATPLAVDGHLFISAGENHGSVLLRLEPTGDTFHPIVVWASQGNQSVLRNEWQTSVLLNKHLYGFDNVGSAGPVTHLTCIKARTGERVWQKTRFGKGNLIAADRKLFISTMKGELVVVRASAADFEEIGRVSLLGPTRQAPTLCNGLLYMRDDKEIVCVDVRDKPE